MCFKDPLLEVLYNIHFLCINNVLLLYDFVHFDITEGFTVVIPNAMIS